MAAAYAAITSLMHLLESLREYPHPDIKQLDEKSVDSLNSMISFSQKFLEDHHSTVDLGLETRIAEAALAAEHFIETYMVDGILGPSGLRIYAQQVSDHLSYAERHIDRGNKLRYLRGNKDVANSYRESGMK